MLTRLRHTAAAPAAASPAAAAPVAASPAAAAHTDCARCRKCGASKACWQGCVTLPHARCAATSRTVTVLGAHAQAGYLDLFAVPAARVPVVKLKDPISGFCCDICINNTLALHNTQVSGAPAAAAPAPFSPHPTTPQMLRTYALIDERVRQLVFVIKHWAKQRRINSPPMGTLSSYGTSRRAGGQRRLLQP